MGAHNPEQRFTEIICRLRQTYPDRAGVALVEGLPPLARVAFTARIARRVQRLASFKVESAHLVVECAIRAAEKAASGEAVTPDEDLAASDQAVLQACKLEKARGDEAAGEGGTVARKTARCVYGPELAYGENALLADWDLQRAAERVARSRSSDAGCVKRAIQNEVAATEADLRTLTLFAEATGEGWRDPKLHSPLPTRDDRGWAQMLVEMGVASAAWPAGRNAEKWRRIHEAIRRDGGCFYPPGLFGQISPSGLQL